MIKDYCLKSPTKIKLWTQIKLSRQKNNLYGLPKEPFINDKNITGLHLQDNFTSQNLSNIKSKTILPVSPIWRRRRTKPGIPIWIELKQIASSVIFFYNFQVNNFVHTAKMTGPCSRGMMGGGVNEWQRFCIIKKGLQKWLLISMTNVTDASVDSRRCIVFWKYCWKENGKMTKHLW